MANLNEVNDREYWRNKNPKGLENIEKIFEDIKKEIPGYELHYIPAYIGCRKADGTKKPLNFVVFKPEKKGIVLEFWIVKDTDGLLSTKEIDILPYTNSGQYKVIVQNYEEYLEKKEIINKLLKHSEKVLLTKNSDVWKETSKETGMKKVTSNMSITLSEIINHPKNIILFGPPGTGKTYNTATYAIAIIEGKRWEEVKEEDYKEVFLRYLEKKDSEQNQIEFVTFHQSYSYEDFVEGIKPDIDRESKSITYNVEPGVFRNFCKKAEDDKENNYVFIIDEINRGNISKIFGELITLIEEPKRLGEKEEIRVKLPYSKYSFGVPNNVYILGTMNTADRSLTRIDTALRRRFTFKEIMPNTNVLKGIEIEGINISELLETMNERIEFLIDRDHTIGHAYFIDLKEKPTLTELGKIFKYRIIPLLQEYFYNDFQKIRAVLGETDQNPQFNFIKKTKISSGLFKPGVSQNAIPTERYEINYDTFNEPKSYQKIYREINEDE